MTDKATLTGYPSIDKSWEKYYSEEEKNMTVPKGSMFDYMYERNKGFPSDIALEYYGRKTSYGELFKLIDSCGRNLAALGVKKGDIVTVQTIPLPQVVVIIYALNRMGACGNMLYPDAKAKDVIASMEKTDSKVLIVVDKILSSYEQDLPPYFDKHIILLNIAEQMSFVPRMLAKRKLSYHQLNKEIKTNSWKAFINGQGIDYEENHDGTLPAFMFRTGGTTGIPKEVLLSSNNFNYVAEGVYHSRISDKWNRKKTSLLLLPPFIAFGTGSGIHHSLSYGTKLVITLDVSPAVIAGLFEKYRPNYITAGAVQIEQLVYDWDKRKASLEYVEMLAIGGEAITLTFEEKLQLFLKKHGCDAIPIKGYGLTETTGCVIAERIDAHKIGSVGIPLSLCELRIIDTTNGLDLGYDTAGEICISSPGIMQGYFMNQEATDEIIEEKDGIRWLHTGDIGTISQDGLLTITGRIKRIIVVKEGTLYHKVFPLLLEGQLVKIPGIQEICIVGRQDSETGNALVAFVVPKDMGAFQETERRLKDYCNTNLQSFEKPKEYIFLKEMPRTLIGKVDYRKLGQSQEECSE